ncbi:MAG TPA: FG-GAP-like repeat-containing protein [Candidatus Goldiibacteriota bacterium]|nr:FG-GAP-like repeat-containing protein [Candidatus Goldiibacteriota bacterium]HRQ43083.1 FG-GAP-like repeat-containing protein [Candidatus Goldiibacteriota bacterium]
MKKITLILSALFAVSASVYSNTLSAVNSFESGLYPRGIAIADTNGDAKNEILVANFGEDTLIGQGSDVTPTSSIAVFYNGIKSVIAAGKTPRGVAAGDLNADGKADFAVTNYEDGTVMIFEGNDTQTVEVGKYPVGAAIGSIDNEGIKKEDIAVAVYADSKVSVIIRDSKGALEKIDIAVPGNPTDVTIGTLNNERVILSANYNSPTISIIKKQGGVISKTADLPAGAGVCKVEIADVTGDGSQDIIAANFHDNTISVTEFKNGAAMEPVIYKLNGLRPNGLAAGDINGDGLIDVVAANRDSDSIDILTQKNGRLELTQSITVTEDENKTYGPVEVAIGDVNADGLADIAFTHMRTGTLKVIYQEAEKKEEPADIPEMNKNTVYNYPNPAKTQTTFRFPLREKQEVKIAVLDIKGNLVWSKTIPESESAAGINYITWNLVNDIGQSVSNGAYILKVITKDKVISKNIAIVK